MSSATMRVFVSYTHDSVAHNLQVRSLVEELRRNGIDAHFDQELNGTPQRGFPAWMEDEIRAADFVLVVCTETYLKRYEDREDPTKGKGSKWEGGIVRQELYDAAGRNAKFAAILFKPEDEQYKPGPLQPHTHYLVPRETTQLLRWLTSQPAYIPPPLGKVPRLPPDP